MTTETKSSIVRIALTLGTAELRALCDELDGAPVDTVRGAARITTPASSNGGSNGHANGTAPRARRNGAPPLSARLVAFVAETPRTFAQIRAHFVSHSPNQLSQALHSAKSQGRVSKRKRGPGGLWRARQSA